MQGLSACVCADHAIGTYSVHVLVRLFVTASRRGFVPTHVRAHASKST